jgi:biopolymer transport protein ExbD
MAASRKRGPFAALALDAALAALALISACSLFFTGTPQADRQPEVMVETDAPARAASTTIHLGTDNRLSLNGEKLDEAALVDRLTSQGQPPAVVSLVVSADALYANVASVLRLLGAARVEDVHISTGP